MDQTTHAGRDDVPAIGILLLAHAPLASAYARVAKDLGLATTHLMAFDMPTGMTREIAFAAAKSLVADSPAGGCLVLVDLGGGCSPVVVADRLQAAFGDRVRIVTGLNTAMLMTALCDEHAELSAAAHHAARRGRDDIRDSFRPEGER